MLSGFFGFVFDGCWHKWGAWWLLRDVKGHPYVERSCKKCKKLQSHEY